MPLIRRRRVAPPPPAGPESLADVLAEVRRIELQTTRFVTDVLVGGYRSTFRGVGMEFADSREYVEGDDPRHVDWNVTARMGRPFVKRFVEERERTLAFVLDLDPAMAHGFGAWSLRQLAARFCALLGLAAIANHDRVGLVAGGGEVGRLVLPKSGGGHVLRVVRDCLQQPHDGGSDLSSLLGTVSARLRRRAVVFVLSPFLSTGHERAMQLCARRHDLVAVRLLPRELIDPPRAVFDAVDPATGERRRCDFRSDRFRAAWSERVRAWRAGHDDLLTRRGIDGIDLEVPAEPDVRSIARALERFFRRRALREAKR
jgi:uncharacterized protein (DUF58 family)